MDDESIVTIVFSASGVLFVILGFLVKKYPNLIAGYNTMSKEQKEKVDIEGLSNLMRKGLIVMGILILITSPILSLFSTVGYGTIVYLAIVGTGSVYMVVKGQAYSSRKTD